MGRLAGIAGLAEIPQLLAAAGGELPGRGLDRRRAVAFGIVALGGIGGDLQHQTRGPLGAEMPARIEDESAIDDMSRQGGIDRLDLDAGDALIGGLSHGAGTEKQDRQDEDR